MIITNTDEGTVGLRPIRYGSPKLIFH